MLQKFSGETLELSFANFRRLREAAVPPQDLEGIYRAGYEHTDEFIRSGKICDFYSHQDKVPVTSVNI